MILKHFTQTEQDASSSQPSMLINMASYNIICDVEAINLLKLKQSQGIQFTQDQDTGDWHFFVATTEDAIALKKFTSPPKNSILVIEPCAKNLAIRTYLQNTKT